MTENLTRLCDCGACDTPIDTDAVGSPNTDGAYCSDFCAKHAGGTFMNAKAKHREEKR